MSDPFTDWQVVQKYKVRCSQRSQGMHFYLMIIHSWCFHWFFSMCFHSHLVSSVRYSYGYFSLFLFYLLHANISVLNTLPEKKSTFQSWTMANVHFPPWTVKPFVMLPWTIKTVHFLPSSGFTGDLDWLGAPQCHAAGMSSNSIFSSIIFSSISNIFCQNF
jgi:hypothetical protein